MATSAESNPFPSGNTYFIQRSQTELVRMLEQDRLLTQSLGGLLPEQADPAAFLASFERVLDVACGTGGWARELAQSFPHLEVTGFDIDSQMIEYANVLARASELDNVSFSIMDASGPLNYPDASFDLINARYFSVVPRTTWKYALQEVLRITRPGGWIRLTEAENNSLTTSPAFQRLTGLLLQSLKQRGIGFSADGHSTATTLMLAHMLRKLECLNVQMHPFVIDWSAGTEWYAPISQDRLIFLRLILPHLVNAQMLSQEETGELYRQAEMEMLSEDFCAHWYFLTAWGQKPGA